MKIIVVSKPSYTREEHQIVNELFEAGLEIFHLRKPKFSKVEIMRFIEFVPYMYRNRIVLHSHHAMCEELGLMGIHHPGKKTSLIKKIKNLGIGKREKKIKTESIHRSRSLHSIKELIRCREKLDYVILSPIYDSISKRKYKSKFRNKSKLASALHQTKLNVIALGGIELNNINELNELGFKGVALLGAVWKNDNPIESFLKIKEECEKPISDDNNVDLNVIKKTYRVRSVGI